MKKLIILALILAVAVCVLVACGGETDPNVPDTDPIATEAPGTEHAHEIIIEQLAATCQAEGYKRAVCTTCGEVVDSVTYGKIECAPAAEATCTEDSVCATCGGLIQIAKGHSFGEAVVVEATCTVEGSKTKTCSVCGETSVETTPVIAHNVPDANVTSSVQATCTTEGSKTGVCTLCNKEQTVAVSAKHVVGGESLSDLTVSDGSVHFTCALCGKALDGSAVLSLTFDETDVAAALGLWVTEENGLTYGEIHEPDQTSGSVKSPYVKTYADVNDGHTTVLHLPHNRSVAIGFNGALFNDASYYVISFDWRITMVGNNSSKMGIVGIANEKHVGPVTDDQYSNAVRVDRSNGKIYGGGDSESFQLTATENQWYNIVVIVDVKTGETSTYIDGKYFCTVKNDKWIVTEGGEWSWRLGGKFNAFHQPEFDNFKVLAY